ncbi:MAG: transcription-repair coupling factor, partial [Gammaproteobacteria bacterium]|nr:transcription-repair coupling factor [Gammaproteobacteria bacterium]
MSDNNRISPFSPQVPKKPGERRYWGRLYGSSKALAISRAACAIEAPVIVVTMDTLSAGRLLEELKFYTDRNAAIDLLAFPDWETLPYDLFSPYQDIISDRLAALARLSTLKRGVLAVPMTTVMHRLLPKAHLLSHSLMLKTGQQLDINLFKRQLIESGYVFTGQVMEHGDAAIRGSLIDIFPMGSVHPYRIDLFDNEIDSIREFDPETQRSLKKIESINILPAKEIALIDEGIARFRSNWRTRFEGNPGQCPVYRDVSQGLAPAGIEYYLPLFYQETNSLFDYVADNALIILDENVTDAAESFWQDIEDRYEQMRHDVERPLLSPREMFFTPHDVLQRIEPFAQVHVTGMAQEERDHAVNYATTLPSQLPVDARATEPLAILKQFLDKFQGRVLFIAESAGRRETLIELFQQQDIKPELLIDWDDFLAGTERLGLTIALLEHGAQIDDPGIAIISESQLFGERVMQRRLRKRRQQDTEAIIKNLTELTPNAPVVHEDHGVGRYQGLVTLKVADIPGEFICIEYAQGDKLYVPVSALDLITRYTGVDPEHAPLHRLGSGQWEKIRKKAAERVYDIAAELLEVHARRAARSGYCFDVDENEYRAFIQSFPFEETPGQADAISAVIDDMREAKPMDRLVCGDSGFGKTEVAMRAAFVAVQNGKQVALLVPTTLLAQQHFRNFKDRFADWPVHIELLSRFRSGKEQEKVLNDLTAGTVDIVIGTHKLIQDTIKFSRLGLLIIDEEHRFGVRQKEKFKALRAEIDILTLTATPIPRTLNMALSDLRELSIIATPPSRRLAVKTFVREWNSALVREAMLREIKRGGQVYFLHNEIKTIDKRAAEIKALMPEASVRIAHGQMSEKELEQVMLDFYHLRFNVLVCTTIIETGIDVPSANTMIINRADKFGLAQLYQLRGRVGRSHHRAYAYLIVPERKAITADALKRLEAIESLDELGVGFTLATYDLEIRGAGEILGEEQSGQIQEVGFGLYMDMLERAIHALKAGKQPELDRPLEHGAEINLHIAALIPEDYMPDVHARLIMYKRIASARDENELTDLQEEMIDRFGLLPEPVKNLFQITTLKLKANPLGIRKIDLGKQGGRLHFHS